MTQLLCNATPDPAWGSGVFSRVASSESKDLTDTITGRTSRSDGSMPRPPLVTV